MFWFINFSFVPRQVSKKKTISFFFSLFIVYTVDAYVCVCVFVCLNVSIFSYACFVFISIFIIYIIITVHLFISSKWKTLKRTRRCVSFFFISNRQLSKALHIWKLLLGLKNSMAFDVI